MKFTNYIYNQVDGFQKVGKKIVKPKSDAEKAISRAITIILLITAIAFYGFILKLRLNISLRIHLRAWIYLIPWLSFVVIFYKGVSRSSILSSGIAYDWYYYGRCCHDIMGYWSS